MKTLHSLSEQLGGLLANQQQILASAESCAPAVVWLIG